MYLLMSIFCLGTMYNVIYCVASFYLLHIFRLVRRVPGLKPSIPTLYLYIYLGQGGESLDKNLVYQLYIYIYIQIREKSPWIKTKYTNSIFIYIFRLGRRVPGSKPSIPTLHLYIYIQVREESPWIKTQYTNYTFQHIFRLVRRVPEPEI